MALLKNKNLANKSVITAYGKIQFSAQGIADVEDSVAEKLATLKDYELVGSSENNDDEVVDENDSDEEVTDETTDDEVVDEEDEETTDDEEEDDDLKAELEAMNVKQLEKYAKDNDIDLNGATKKADIISAILGE